GRDGLPLKRLAELVKQACIFDGDHSLRGKILHQIYLLIIEGSDLLAIDSDSTNQVILLEHLRPASSQRRGRGYEPSDGEKPDHARYQRPKPWVHCGAQHA